MREQQSREIAQLTQAVRESSTAITGRLERLQAIEVSVKDLGEEVTRTLGAMVQDAMGDHIKTFLGDIRDEAEKMRAQMESSLRGNLSELAAKLGTSLDRIQATLSSQSSSEVEKLLGKLQDVVTGGFSSETRNMAGLVEQLQKVISQLSHELGGVGSLLRETLDGFQQQNRDQQALLASVAVSTHENVKRLGDDFVREGSEAMTRVLTETNARIERMMTALDQASASAAGRSSASVAEFEALARKVSTVTEDLGASAELVSELMRQVQATLQASSSGVTQISDAAAELKAAAERASDTMRASDDTRRALEASLEQQAHITTRNASSLEKMENVWPQLLQDVATTVESTTGNMLGSWEKLSDKLAAATTLYGQAVGDRVDDLHEAVAKLTEQVKRLPDTRR
jgi:ABC-type transporter Mla subunit MlaD